MKNLFSVLFISIFTTIYTQNERFSISVGKPWFPDKIKNLNNFSFGINYQNLFSQSFSFDLYTEYTQSDDFPDFYHNNNDLNNFLLNQKFDDILVNSQWSKISNLNLGSTLNYLFVNNSKFLFGFNVGLGYMFSKSSSHHLKKWNYNQESGQIISYENTTISDNLNTFYYTLGLQFQYTLYKEYFIGIKPYYLMPLGSKKMNTIPVYPNYYNLTFNIGKKF